MTRILDPDWSREVTRPGYWTVISRYLRHVTRGKGWVARNPYYMDRRGRSDQREVYIPSREEKQAVAGIDHFLTSVFMQQGFKRVVDVFPTLPCSLED